MNRIQFNGPFLSLMQSYTVKLTTGQQDSYFEELKTGNSRDWEHAVTTD